MFFFLSSGANGKGKFGLYVCIEESFTDTTFKVMASFLSVCEDIFKAVLFCCFLFILSTQKSIEKSKVSFCA